MFDSPGASSSLSDSSRLNNILESGITGPIEGNLEIVSPKTIIWAIFKCLELEFPQDIMVQSVY